MLCVLCATTRFNDGKTVIHCPTAPTAEYAPLNGPTAFGTIPEPPHVSIAEIAVAPADGIHLLHRRHDADDAARPLAGDDLAAIPIAFAQHQIADARHVTRRHPNRVGRVLGDREIAFLVLRRSIPILELQRDGELRLELVVDIASRELFEDRAGDVEIPVAVQHVGAGLLRTARRRLRQIVAGVRRGMVDTGARRDDVTDRRLLFDREETADVIDVQLLRASCRA